MAATIARAYGTDKNRVKEVHRLGSQYSTGVAATWQTTAEATVFADGHGYVMVRRNDRTLHTFEFGPEDRD